MGSEKRLLAAVYLFSGLSRQGTSFDSRWSVYVAMSLWRHGTTRLDEYSETIRKNDYYAIEWVSPDGQARHAGPEPCDGHLYNSYPVGVSVLVAPLIGAEVGLLKLASPLLSRIHAARPVIAGFLRADYDTAHPLIEMEAPRPSCWRLRR